ncbi:MAG: helix-turn-helix domain-containing protein [Ilumatobacteraceae bacterium]
MEQNHAFSHQPENLTSVVSPETSRDNHSVDRERFREFRRGLKMSQGEVARHCVCSPSFISKWEKGQSKPGVEMSQCLGRFLAEMELRFDPTFVGKKRCWNCERHLDLSHFAKDGSRKHGVQSKCRDCNSVYALDWQDTNRAQINERRKARRTKANSKRLSGFKWTNRDSRDIAEFRALGDYNFLRLRKNPNGALVVGKKSGIERQADAILKAEDEANPEKIEPCQPDMFGIAVDEYGAALREMWLASRISKNQLCKLAKLYVRRFGIVTNLTIPIAQPNGCL